MNYTTLHKINYGLYVVSAKKDNKFNGCIVNTVFQITAEPATIAVSVNKENLSNSYIAHANSFTISILAESAPMTLIGPFGFRCGTSVDKFKGINYKTGKNGIPYLTEHTVGYIEADVINSVDVGTHTLFIGKITDMDIIGDGNPMTYSYYHQIKGGKTPEKAATFIDPDKEEETDKNKVSEETDKAKYVCNVCGYVYDPEKGDPENGVPAGTPWENVPENWQCPLCGVGKDQFTKQ